MSCSFHLSVEEGVHRRVENPYYQFFTGEEFFQHKLPINPSQMTKWRKRIGGKGVERMLQLNIYAGLRTKTITHRSVDRVIVDTTVQPKAIAHPTDARLYRKVHVGMVRIAKAKAKQFRRARREQKRLKVCAGRLMRHVANQLSDEAYDWVGRYLLHTDPPGSDW